MATPITDYWQEYKNSVAKSEEIFASILNELNTHPKYQDYFNQFHPDSVITFKDFFARYKTNCIVHEEIYRNKEEEIIHQYSDGANRCLWEIQHFKLLIAEGLWRSNKIEIPEITYIHEFLYWHIHIEQCTFIEPITQNDVERYIAYLKQEESKEVLEPEYMHNFAAFNGVRDSIEKDEKIAPYVAYMINLFGKQLFLIDDIKGQEEKHYKNAHTEHEKILEAAKPNKPTPDTRPYKSLHYDADFEDVVSKFGEPQMLDFKNTDWFLKTFYSSWRYFEDSCELLEEAGDNYPIDYAPDWHYALINAAQKYKKENITKAIQAVYEEYLFRLHNNIAFTKYNGYRVAEERYDWLSKRSVEQIESGKKLLGK